MKSKYRPKLIPNNEIALNDFDDAVTIAKILMKNGNVVMFSEEEDLTIVNFMWSQGECDRNDVVFMDRCDFEEYCTIRGYDDDDDEDE